MTSHFVEPLAPRRLLAGVTASYAEGILTIIGTRGFDGIEIGVGSQGGIRVTNGYSPTDSLVTEAPASTRLVRVFGGAGGDRIIVSPRLNTPTRFSIDGGDGDDVLQGGSHDDTLFGGRGDDRIAGGRGNDYLDAGLGNDYMEDTVGVNVFHGGGGHDGALADAAKLGTGVETEGYRRRTASGGTPSNFSTNLVRRQDRLVLLYRKPVHGGIDNSGFDPLKKRPDGSFELAYRNRHVGGGAIIFEPEDVEADVTAATGRTLYLNDGVDEGGFRVPLFIRL